MTEARLRPLLRGAAIAIALFALIDPAFTIRGTQREAIAVLPANPLADSALATRVRVALDDEFTVVRGAFGAAQATVVVGDALPVGHGELPGPVFVVSRGIAAPRISIERLHVPRRAPLDARIAVHATIVVRGARGRTLDVALRSGELAVAHTTHRIAANDVRLEVPLDFTPSATGVAHLRLEASLSGGRPELATADAAISVTREGWRVLFHDTRPSWTSTFVRRVAERDGRFTVASRIATTRGAASDAGRPPSLGDRSARDAVDLIVVGAPEALTAGDVDALDAFLRRRGGSVIVLLDEGAQVAAPVFTRLIAAGAWRTRTGGAALAIGGDAGLRGIELTWPVELPPGAEAIAVTNTGDGPRAPVVWGTQVGAGRLIVSGALDAWRFRDSSQSSFESFWRDLLAAEAARALPPIDVRVEPAVIAPGARAGLTVTMRAPAIAPAITPAITPAIAGASAAGRSGEPLRVSVRAPARLWPGESVGELVGAFRAPDREGPVEVRVISGLDTGVVDLIVSATPSVAQPDRSGVLAAWAASTGGRNFTVDQLGQLGAAIGDAIRSEARPRPWHPMRSPWWIVPFVVLLSAEWWMRRRRGLA